jgi:hypothetical protein
MIVLIKLLGAFLVLSVGGFSVFGTVRYEKKRITVLEGWIDLILYIRSQIDCYLTPLSEILLSTDPDLMRACTSGSDDADLGAILRSSAIYLDGSTKRLLERFVRKIGDGYREEQIKHCDYYVSALRAARDRMATDRPSRIRLYSTVSICTAIGTAILLW